MLQGEARQEGLPSRFVPLMEHLTTLPRCCASLSGLTVREPGEYRNPREPPLVAEAPARQIAFLCPRANGVDRQLEERRRFLEGEHFVTVKVRPVGDLDSADGNRTSALCQPIRQEFADQVLLLPASRAGQAVEGGCLMPGESHEQRSFPIGHI
jgi:hypothetical protein